MLDVFYVDINESIAMNNINELILYISAEKAAKIMKFYDTKDIYRSVLGEILARYLIFCRTNCLNENVKINVGKNSKPILTYPNNLHFNISHSNDLVMCALSNVDIGVDIEHMKKTQKTNLEVVSRFFTDDEYNYILSFNCEDEIQKSFYKIWTLKESYVKTIGKGLLLPFKSFSMIINKHNISIESSSDLRKYYFKTYQVRNDYIASICSLSDFKQEKIEQIDIQEILGVLGGNSIGQ